MREMKDSRQFPRSLFVANGIMMIVYIFISSIAYGAAAVLNLRSWCEAADIKYAVQP